MKGILFTEPMFHAVVAGTKTQTRRIVKEDLTDYVFVGNGEELCIDKKNAKKWLVYEKVTTSGLKDYYLQPRYHPGEIVYLKEPYSHIGSKEVYKYLTDEPENVLWNNKLFMKAEYARYFINIVNVRVENINDISEQDVIAEGFKDRLDFFVSFIKINKAKLLSQTPWVFAYTFELTANPLKSKV